MAEERVVFDFTDEVILERINDSESDLYDTYDRLLNERIETYSVKKSIDKVTISFITENKEEHDCIYRRILGREIENMIIEHNKVNLEGCYIDFFSSTTFNNKHKEYEILDFNARNSFWEGVFDFTRIKFGTGNVDFSAAKFGTSHVDFNYAQFGTGNVFFDFVDFGKCHISFLNAQFGEGNVTFFHTLFGKGRLNFDMTKFEKGILDFRESQFDECIVSFLRTNFSDVDVNFSDTHFSKGSVSFIQSKFGVGGISFGNSYSDEVIFKRINFLSHIDLKFKEINSLFIEECIIEKTLKISGFHRERVETECKTKRSSLSFTATTNLGQIHFYEKPRHIVKAMKRHIKEKNKKKPKLPEQPILKSITMIKENYHVLGEYDGEDLAYKAYMKYKTNTWYGWPLKFFNLVGGYGTKPLRIIITMFITMFGFAGAYFAFFMNQFKDTLSTFWDTLYYSGITFLTIGYGDISPAFEKSMGLRFVSVAEGFIGLFLMSYLTVAVVRKLLR